MLYNPQNRIMNNCSIWIRISALLIALMVFSGCSPDVPVRYPTIELPLAGGMSTSTVIDDIIEVPASELWHKTIEIPSSLDGVKLAGWCVASGGARNDVKVLVLDDIDFHNWRNFNQVKGLYQSEKIHVATLDVDIETPGKYHLVISNWFSEFSSKKVIAKVYLYWSVKAVTYKIRADDISLNSDDFQIPKGADVTFEFIEKVDTGNFQISRDGKETHVSANITDLEVKFIAPSTGIYNFSCGNINLMIEGGFSVVPAEPVIGRGFTVSSSMANAPPRIERITYDNERPLNDFTIEAIDPDDDTLTYYAFNLPMAVSGYDEDGRRIWSTAGTLDKNSGVFSWNEVSANVSAGKYFVRFEVSDGILSDQQDVVIEIK